MATKKPNPPSPRPAKLRPERVVALARACADAKPGHAIYWNPHLWKDHPERLIETHHLLRALLSPKARVDRAKDVFRPTHGKWTYLIETELRGHRMHVAVAFDPPLPGETEGVVLEFLTAYFPDEKDGALPQDLR